MNGNDIIARWTNYTDKEQILTVKKTDIIDSLYRSNVIEEKLEELNFENGKCEITVNPYEILTLYVKKNLIFK